MKVLPVTDKDVDAYGDWLKGDAADTFIEGNYTHVRDGEAIIRCEHQGQLSSGAPMVAVLEQVNV